MTGKNYFGRWWKQLKNRREKVFTRLQRIAMRRSDLLSVPKYASVVLPSITTFATPVEHLLNQGSLRGQEADGVDFVESGDRGGRKFDAHSRDGRTGLGRN